MNTSTTRRRIIAGMIASFTMLFLALFAMQGTASAQCNHYTVSYTGLFNPGSVTVGMNYQFVSLPARVIPYGTSGQTFPAPTTSGPLIDVFLNLPGYPLSPVTVPNDGQHHIYGPISGVYPAPVCYDVYIDFDFAGCPHVHITTVYC